MTPCLTGSIPTTLGNLTNLIAINLGSNQLTGSIPTTLGNLTSLSSLYLYNNQLTGGIPTTLGNLTSLIVLYLSGNQLTGSIPTTLGNLTRLTQLDLGSNLLTGSIPASISNLPAASVLDLDDNYFNLSAGSQNLANINAAIVKGIKVNDSPQSSGLLVVDENSGLKIPNGGTTYILGESPPKMPNLEAINLASAPNNWSLDVIDSQRVTKTGNKVEVKASATLAGGVTWFPHGGTGSFPGKTYFSYNGMTLLNGNKYVQPGRSTVAEEATEDNFFGGDSATITVSGNSKPITFSIKGKNPSRALVESYLDAQAPAYRYAKWIIWHESYSTQLKAGFNQFDSNSEPLYGPPDGWGMAQLDGYALGRFITSDELWNWQANVDSSLALMAQKRALIPGLLSKYQAYLKTAYHLTTLDPLPATTAVSGIPVNFTDAAEIVAYSGVPYDGTAKLYTCWSYNVNAAAGSRWSIRDNSKNYLHAVIPLAKSSGFPILTQ